MERLLLGQALSPVSGKWLSVPPVYARSATGGRAHRTHDHDG
ncbi:hypothetical protein RKE29_01200 [Streptomyces sp. B1866]|nr:hypothetical protein [Streptomyces sp. B1866]MDT3395277.1 hypothetical protein [Streptomyces sp. B1866]